MKIYNVPIYKKKEMMVNADRDIAHVLQNASVFLPLQQKKPNFSGLIYEGIPRNIIQIFGNLQKTRGTLLKFNNGMPKWLTDILQRWPVKQFRRHNNMWLFR